MAQKLPLILLNNASECKCSDGESSSKPKRSLEVLPISEREIILHLLCLICQLNFIIGIYANEKDLDIGFATIRYFGIRGRSLECIPLQI